MPSLYLDLLDELLRDGLAQLSQAFVAAQVAMVAGCQRPDGGFSGRQGGADLYYTDFALRTLAWLAPNHEAMRRAKAFLATRAAPRDTVECYNLLSARRSNGATSAPAEDLLTVTDCLYARLLPCGGFGRSDGDQRVSAYHTFLGMLALQLIAVELPLVEETAMALGRLRTADGGYAELAGQDSPQTSATAAAVAVLTMCNALSPAEAAATAQFLLGMQGADGGLRAHAAAQHGDLLSTFTGLLTLAALDGLGRIDASAAAHFLRRTAHPLGGFVASEGDDIPDVEYTYYGIGTLALLRVLVRQVA
jgi:geranylgeranyl transferase type-2 subunit beta